MAAGLDRPVVAQPDAARANGPVTRYDGDKVVRVQIRRVSDLQIALALTDDVWSHSIHRSGPLDIHVTPEQFAAFVKAETDKFRGIIKKEGLQMDVN